MHLKLSHIRHIIKTKLTLLKKTTFHLKASPHKTYNKKTKLKGCRQVEKHAKINDYKIVSDKGAIINLKITRPTHTSLGGVSDLATAAKKLIVKLVDK